MKDGIVEGSVGADEKRIRAFVGERARK